jgi:hypothetical protein
MVAEVFQCPQCSQLNTTRSIACKKCGANLQQVLDSINAKNRSTLILDIIVIVAVLGVIAVAMPKFPLDRRIFTEIGVARGVGSALKSTITNKHGNYLINGTEYTTSDVLADTQYFGGITATTGSPADGQIGYSGNVIRLNYKNKIYEWDYIPRNGDTPAYMVENTDSDF